MTSRVRRRLVVVILVATLLEAVSGQIVVPLSSDLTAQLRNNVENGALLFVSSNDDPDLLRKIIFESNGLSSTAYDLSVKRKGATSGQKLGWALSNNLTVTTTNNGLQTASLKGVVYVTSAQQAKDPNLVVFDVVKKELIRMSPGSNAVFFNYGRNRTNLYEPLYGCQISDVQQSSVTKLEMRVGAPGVDVPYTQATFFANPFSYNQKVHFFDQIEPMSVLFNAFNVAIDGADGMNFFIEPIDTVAWELHTTSVNSTGFVMRGVDDHTHDIRVSFLRDESPRATTGSGTLSGLVPQTTVTVSIDSQASGSFPYTVSGKSWVTYEVMVNAETLAIDASDDFVGMFAVQFFHEQGQYDSGQTTPRVPTTTRSTDQKQANLLGFLLLAILVLVS